MAAAAVASHTTPQSFSPSSPSELRKQLSPTNGSRANQKPMSTTNTNPNTKPNTKPAPIPRGKRERPCDACRRRKSKCVVTEGTKICAACGIHGQDCTYVEDPQPRKRKVDSESLAPESSKRRSQVSPVSDISSTPSVPKPDSQVQPKTSAPVIPRPTVTPSTSTKPITDQYSGLHVGPTTELEPLLLALSTNESAWLGEMYQTRGSTPFLIDRAAAERFKVASMSSQQTIASLVGSHGPFLIQTYINNIHPSFPILCSLTPESFPSLPPILLAAIYTSTIPFLPSTLPVDVSTLESLAFALFSESLPSPTLATVQAGILLMQRPGIDSRSLNTQLVSAACDLGLNVDCNSWGLSEQEVSLRKRAAWAVYVQDKWTALVHGRPGCIRAEDWAVEPLSTEDFSQDVASNANQNQDDMQRGHDAFVELVRLSEILSTVLDTFYTLRAMKEVEKAGTGGVRLILERAKPVQIRLKEWFGGLRASCKMDSSTSATASSSAPPSGAVAFLHLAYFATEITLHRCIIRSLHAPSAPPTTSRPSPPPSSPEPTVGSSSSADPMLTHICRAAAKTRLISAMDFINRLRPAQYRALATYFPAPTCFSLVASFGALLRATSPAREEEEFYARRLQEFRWTLGVSAKGLDGSGGPNTTGEDGRQGGSGAEWLAQAISWVDAWEEVCAGLAENKPSASEGTPVAGRAVGKAADVAFGNDGVQSVRFAQIGEGETGLVSPSASTDTGESYEVWGLGGR